MRKRITAIILCVVLLIPVTGIFGLTASAAKKGDMDGDGTVTVADALIALRIASKLAEETPASLATGDTDGDKHVTVADALAILRVAAKLAQFEEEEEIYNFSSAAVGDTIVFGHYEQDNNTKNGKEPVEWNVVKAENGKILVTSRYVLTCIPMTYSSMGTTWSESLLRGWLNGTFMNDAFTPAEWKKIVTTDIVPDKSSFEGVNVGDATKDKMFALSRKEVDELFPTDKEKRCLPTEYAKAKGAVERMYGACSWWTRTVSNCQENFYVVYGNDGYAHTPATSDVVGVRPAMWLNAADVSKDQTVVFGHYEQDNNTENGKEPIEWNLLRVQSGKMLLISKYALDTRTFHYKEADTSWDSCTLHGWMGATFLSEAFTEEEQKKIADTMVRADSGAYPGVYPGLMTTDKVFILSYREIDEYFPTEESKICSPTPYAEAKGAVTSRWGTCGWWLRTPSYDQKNFYVVGGNAVTATSPCYSKGYGIRPAMWVYIN